jgi:C-terminal processing protease CtpA/Prc
MVYREFPLKGGEKLQIGVAPVRLGDGTALGSKGVDPDIKVDVSAANERAYYEDPFRFVGPTNQLTLARAGGGTPARRARFGEAELVRERREGGESDTEAVARRAEPDAPVVYDPALARALDLLKGLYVVRQGRS